MTGFCADFAGAEGGAGGVFLVEADAAGDFGSRRGDAADGAGAAEASWFSSKVPSSLRMVPSSLATAGDADDDASALPSMVGELKMAFSSMVSRLMKLGLLSC